MEYNPLKLSELLNSPTLKLSGISKAAGISSGYATELKAGRKEPSARILGRIANALGVPVSYFFDHDSHFSEKEPA